MKKEENYLVLFIFSSQLVYQMGINDRCAVGACKNARKYPERYVIKPHIAAFNTSLSLHFWKCSDPKLYPKWTFACNRKNFKFGKNNYICSNHFQYGRPTGVSPIPTLFLKGYNETAAECNKRKALAMRNPMPQEITPKKGKEYTLPQYQQK